jgi:hypothetical protein
VAPYPTVFSTPLQIQVQIVITKYFIHKYDCLIASFLDYLAAEIQLHKVSVYRAEGAS